MGASPGYWTTIWNGESDGGTVASGTGSQEVPELMRGTQSVPSSCLRVASGGKCSTSSSVAAWEPERKGKGVLGLLLGLGPEVHPGLGLLLGQDVEGGPQQPSLVTPVTLALQLLVTVSECNTTVDNLIS